MVPFAYKNFKKYNIPNHIKKPIYYNGKLPIPMENTKIEIKTEEQINKMRKSCKIAKTILGRTNTTLKK